MITENKPFVQYCHSIPYNGRVSALKGNRMTIRIEELQAMAENSPDISFLVTRSVCSPEDQFRRDTGRAQTTLRKNIFLECRKNSGNFVLDPLNSGTFDSTNADIIISKIPDASDDLKYIDFVSVQSYVHSLNGHARRLGEIFTFNKKLTVPKLYVEFILAFYKVSENYV